MNCSQVRASLTIYRELKKEEAETAELEAHLNSCASCRRELDHYSFIGKKIRSLPAIEPSLDAHSRLMQALITEHSRHLEQTAASTASTPIPEFLIPYLHKKGKQGNALHDLASFSSADTGPLPMLPSPRRRRRPSFNQFAILGLAATFLIIFMAGGITGLLALVKPNESVQLPSVIKQNVNQPSLLQPIFPVTYTNYSHIVSAASSRGTIYYTAYGDKSTGWMLERLDPKRNLEDKTPQYSIPVLYNPSAHLLLILGSSQDWLILLQLNNPTLANNDKSSDTKIPNTIVREWSLQALYIGTEPIPDQKYYLPITLQKGTFKEEAVPSWVHTPIQGISFVQDTLLIAMIDEEGDAHLLQQRLNLRGDFTTNELAKATDGRILTSPTATSDGAYIYWSEEWFDGSVPYSNIWMQVTKEAEPPMSGRWVPHTVVEQSIFRDDEASFHPLVVSDTLFLLNTNPLDDKGTPIANASATPAINQTLVNRIDPIIYPDQLDEAIQGNLLAFSARTGEALPDLPLHVKESASALQAGNSFLIWQNSDKSFSMYDVAGKMEVKVGETTISTTASFLSVNGDTAIWMNPTKPAQALTPDSSQGTPVIFSTFSWPLPSWQVKLNKTA